MAWRGNVCSLWILEVWSWVVPQISSLCPQAEGGKKAGAVATVVAAVDLARVRLPLAGEEEEQEVEEAAGGEIRLQTKAITSETRVVETKIVGAGPPPAVTSDQRGVQVSQVRHLLWTPRLWRRLFSCALLITPDSEDTSVLPRGRCRHTGSTFYRF